MTSQGAARGLHRARLTPSGRSFPVHEDQTLLAAAEAAGLQLATSCRNGTCRTCLRALRSGSVEYRIPWPGLLPEERASGAWVLPCVAYPLSDVVLED
jgi:ferredoxin